MKDFGLPKMSIEMPFPTFVSNEKDDDSNGVGEKASPTTFIPAGRSARLFNPNIPIDHRRPLITINTTT